MSLEHAYDSSEQASIENINIHIVTERGRKQEREKAGN